MRYVDQLLEEIEATQGNVKKIIKKYTEHQHALVDDMSQDKDILFGELTGLEKYIFPKEHLLSNADVDQIVAAFYALFRALGINPLFHKGVSQRIKYNLMRDFCCQPIFLNPGSDVDVEFCDYVAHDCPYSATCVAANLLYNNCKAVDQVHLCIMAN